jgi:hypothetical protein
MKGGNTEKDNRFVLKGKQATWKREKRKRGTEEKEEKRKGGKEEKRKRGTEEQKEKEENTKQGKRGQFDRLSARR